MALTAEQFGKALVAAGLMSAEDLKASWNSLPADGRPKDGAGFARTLIDLGRLTPFQAQELLAGRGDRLQMGEYLLLAEIGAGGMGKVYKAQHRRMKRVVALKVMSSAAMQDDAAVKRFQREVEAAARLEHPNIVTAYDSGEAGKVKYLVMQFVDGGDLSDYVKKNGPLPIEAAVDYVLQAARGLAFAHAAGVVHRDIKPANLLLDKKGVVKILDMGLARIEDGDGLTATEQVMGTVDYMSPEQAAETKNADARSDIYSLGCTLWYLLSAKKLYDGDTMISRLMKHRDAELPSLVKTRDDASWPLEQAFHKMIAKRPQDRYQSMEEVIEALEPFGPSGSPSSGGMGSSIGGGKGQSAELASFMQAMAGGKSAGSSASLQTKSATSPAVDATAAFSSAEIGTDPKSALHTRGASPLAGARPQSGGRKKQPPVKLIAGGLGAFALLACFGIWVVVRDKEGHVVAEVAVPDGGDVSVRHTTPIDVAPAVAMTNVTPGAMASAVGSPTLSNTASSAAMNTPAPAAERWPYDPSDGKDYVWSAPENLGRGVNSGDNERLAGVSDDDLAIYFLRRNSILMVARRTRADRPFADAQPVPGITVIGGDAAVSGDQRTLAVVQSPDGRKREVWWSERRSPADVFPELRPLTSDGRPSGAHAMLSPDGLTLLTTTGDVNMWTRSAPGAPFTGPQRLPSPINTSEWDMPGSITADQRLLIVMNQTGSGRTATRRVVYHTRADRNLPFDAARPLDVPLGPAAGLDSTGGFRLSGDGRSVYFSSIHYPGGAGNEDLWVSRRVPKAAPSPSTATPPASLAVADLLESADYVWSEPENLGPNVNTSGGEFSAALSADELCLIFHGDGAPGGESNLWECRRPSIDQPFGPRRRLTGSAYEFDASLSADGLTLFYETHAIPAGRVAKDLRSRTRTSRDGPWSPPVTLELDADHDDQTPWMSDDGSTLIFSSNRPGTLGPSDLWLARRETPAARFSQVTRLGNGVNTPASEQYGRILADGRTIQFVRDGKPHLTFTSPTGVTTALPMRGVGDDVRVPWITADGRRMYFQSDRPGGLGNADLWMSRRVPKGSPPSGAAPGAGNSPPAEPASIAEMLDSPDYVWTEPEPLGPEVNLGGVNTSPVVSSDGLELWFASYGGTQAKVPGQGDEDLWVARRRSLAAPWEPAKNVGPPINDVGKDVNPALSADGLRLVFWRYPEYTLYESKRATTAAPWSEPVNLSAQLGGNINHPWLSADGLELLFSTVPGGKLRRSARPARDAAWGKPTDLPQLSSTLEAAALWVSPDGRGMLGHWLKSRSPNVYEYWLAERATPADPWSAPKRIEFPESMQGIARPYPVLAPTGLELYFFRDQKIHVARRVPTTAPAAGVVYLDDLPEVEAKVGYGALGKHGTYDDLAEKGKQVVRSGAPVAHALWMHPQQGESSFVRYRIDGRFATFAADAGIHENSAVDPRSPVTFRVLGDGRELWKSPPLEKRGESAAVSVDVRGVQELRLETACGDKNGNCHATWFLPRLTPAAAVSGAPAPPRTEDTLDRQVAQRLLDLKFPVRLTVAGKVVPIKPGSPLPAEPFVVSGIDAGASQAAPPAELATLLSDFGRLASVSNTFMPQEDCDLWAATLAAMPSIMAVNASRCEELTDVGAAHLARLPKLEYANIGSSTKITSVGLAAFEKCKTLTTIELNPQAVAEGKYTLADIQKLQDALPKTRIVFGGVKPIPGLQPAGAK